MCILQYCIYVSSDIEYVNPPILYMGTLFLIAAK